MNSCYDRTTCLMWSHPWKSVIYNTKNGIYKLTYHVDHCCATHIWCCGRNWGVNCVIYWDWLVRWMLDVVNNPGDIILSLCTHSHMVDLCILKSSKLWYGVQYSYRIVWRTGFPLFFNCERTRLNLSWYLRLTSQLSIAERTSGVSRSNYDTFSGLSNFSEWLFGSLILWYCERSVQQYDMQVHNSGQYSTSSGFFHFPFLVVWAESGCQFVMISWIVDNFYECWDKNICMLIKDICKK